MSTARTVNPFAELRDTFQRIGRGMTYAIGPTYSVLSGTPMVADTLVPEGQALIMTPPNGPRTIVVGIPSRNATEAALIVREGLADVLAWLGQPVETTALRLARHHYGLTR